MTLFLASGSLATAVTGAVPAFWVVSGVMLAYLPFGKLRHSVYFFYTRAFFGIFFGHRGVLKTARR